MRNSSSDERRNVDGVVPASVSVVIPCYDASAFVTVAVESVLSQTAPVHEVIVVDDGSTDDPAAALAAINDARLRIVRVPNGGVSRARNFGAELATGRFLAFLDADDSWYPTKLERQLALFSAEPVPVAVGAQMHHVGSRGSPMGITGAAELGDEEQQLLRTDGLFGFAISSIVIARTAFEAVGGFDETVLHAEDIDIVARLAVRGPVRTVGEPLGSYRVHTGSASAKHYRAQRMWARFVRERMVARDAGGDLTWQEFTARLPKGTTREWMSDTAGSLYRAGGAFAADRHYFGAAWRLGASVLLKPSYALRRLRHQQVFALLRRDGRAVGG